MELVQQQTLPVDLTQVSDLQSNDLKRSGDVVTLDYTEVPYISQPLATRTENVNPFASHNMDWWC